MVVSAIFAGGVVVQGTKKKKFVVRAVRGKWLMKPGATVVVEGKEFVIF